ncbi:MAG: hypothetical protein HRT88_10230, partial [Lentisphaeraceae bacterium]|nr:hypothetical protein [Lentisphaeraceae bacterium]
MSAEFTKVVETINVSLNGIYQQYEEFNEFYDSAIDTEYFSGLKPSEVLFKCDRIAYDSSRTDWEKEQFSCDFELTFSLLEDEHLKARVEDLIKVLKRGKVAPFVGAGLSIPCGKKSWPNILLDLGAKSQKVDKEILKELIQSGEYLDAADLIESELKSRLPEYIKTTLAVREIGGPIVLLPKLTRECVITSNLD